MNYFKELPSGYTEDFRIDAKDQKTGLILNLLSLLIMIGLFLVCFFTKVKQFLTEEYSWKYLLYLALLLVGMTIVHELTHGIFYKIFTGQKLHFGFSWSCAYCGVLDVYVCKIPSLITTLAPFVLHSIWMIVLLCVLQNQIWVTIISILFAVHTGGCLGDWYVSLLLLKYPKEVLVRDTGAEQTFYLKKEKAI